MARLVAHRGQSLFFPENTIESIQAAINCGAKAVEFDVQMTADGVPVISHDLSLLKTAGIDTKISEINYADVQKISVNETARFGERYQFISLPSLQDMVSLLKDSPQVMAFVELKEDSRKIFGSDDFLKPVIAQLEPIQNRCVLIADNLQVLIASRKNASFPVGWIIHHWDTDSLKQARLNAVEYMVIDHENCEGVKHDYASDDWEWVMYRTCDVNKATDLFNQGVQYVESNDICSMLNQMPEYQ